MKFRKDIFSKDYFANTQKLQFGDINDFIGWWDNAQFIGEPITSIKESDYGDKMFFAKTSKTNYRIRWMTENGEIIHEENMNKNEVLELLKFYSRSNILSIIVKREPLTWKIKVFSKNLEQDTNF